MIRRAADTEATAQVIAANVDVFGLVSSANRDLNPRRIERYLTAVWDSGAAPVIVLNKVDLVEDVWPMLERIEAVALGVPVVRVSALTGEGIETLRTHIGPGTTVGLEVDGPVPISGAVRVGADGRAALLPGPTVPADSDAVLRMSGETFAVLCGGRRPPEDVDVEVMGDAELARRVAGAMAVTP